jgi:phosphopantetheinyl transferase (holo-ACP synthase)
MNTDRGLLFLTLSLTSFWLIFDEFYGNKRLSSLAAKLTPDFPSPVDAAKEAVAKAWNDEPAAQTAKEDAKKKIDKNDKIDSDTKKDLKDMVDHFYGPDPA